MGKLLPKFGPYTIIADTSALYPRDGRKLVSSRFEKALAELREFAAVHLIIPNVVIGELAYQRYVYAKQALEVANSKLGLFAEVTGTTQPKLCSAELAKRRILKRYDTWCKTMTVRRFAPKVKQATWNGIVEDAIWRIPPFEHSQDSKHEKGFRDRVVLEAVLQSCSTSGSETVFLCDDGVLKSAILSRGLKNLTVVPRLEDYASRIRLLKEKAAKEWVSDMFDAAAKEFYADDNADCLYWRAKIPEQIGSRTADLLPPPATNGISTALFEPRVWERQSQEHVTLGTTQFEKSEKGQIEWKTEVSFAAVFSGKGFLDIPVENIRISTFSVHWSSRVTEAAEIHDAKVERIELVGKQMILDTPDSRNQWSLPAKAVPLPLLQTFPDLPKGYPFAPPN